MKSYSAESIKNWDISIVIEYIESISIKSKYFKQNLVKILEFIISNKIDGKKLIWLISPPYENLFTSENTTISGKLKKMDPVLWKGVLWKEFLNPVIELSESDSLARIEICRINGINLNIPNEFDKINDKVLSFVLEDLTVWTIDDVKSYVTARSTSSDCSIGLNNRISDVFSFVDSNSLDGLKLTWLVSPPFETPPKTNAPHVAGKLKNLDPKLWKGVRWKDFLEPIITLHYAPEGTRIELRTGKGMTLVVPEGSASVGVPEARYSQERVYSMKMYEGSGH